jgi:hypothetical protein
MFYQIIRLAQDKFQVFKGDTFEQIKAIIGDVCAIAASNSDISESESPNNETLNKLVLKHEHRFWNEFSGFINASVNMVLHFLVSASLTASSNLVPLLR